MTAPDDTRKQRPCRRTLPHRPHDEHTGSGYPCPGVPLPPEQAAEAAEIWAERDRRIAARWPDLTPVPLSPERLAEIRSTLLGDWLAGGWRVRCVPVPDARDRSEVFLPGAPAEDTVIATLPDWADPVAVFLADAHEAVPELLAEVDRLSKRVAELEAAHAPRLCACGHSLPAHAAPEPHSCFAHGQTCTCPTYRQLPPAEAWAQLDKNIRASEAHAAEQAAAVGAEGGAR
jgi:hypothetical protein